MAKSDRSSQNPQPPHNADSVDLPAESTAAGGERVEESRADRLRRIRQDVDDGKYDSDELLEQALEIMIKKLSGDPE